MLFFLTTLLQVVFAASIPVFVALPINFLSYLSPNFIICWGLWQKAITLNIFSILWLSGISQFYNIYPIIRVTSTLSSVSRSLLFWSVKHTSMDENSGFVVFSIVNEWGDILINWSNYLFRTKVNNTLDACW